MKRFHSSIIRNRRYFVAAIHMGVFACSVAGAFLLRFDFNLPDEQRTMMRTGILLAIVFKSAVFHLLGLNRSSIRNPGMSDLARLVSGNVIATIGFTAGCYGLYGASFPRSIYVIDLLLSATATSAIRFFARLYREAFISSLRSSQGRNIIIYGAGGAGQHLLREITRGPESGYRVLGFLDDDPNKWGALFGGATVLGPGREAAAIVERNRRRKRRHVDEIVIAMPSADGFQMQEALANCRAAGVPCRTIPGVRELLGNEVLLQQIRNISVNDLLGRPPVNIENSRVREELTGKTVLVTGAAGSIGSELCRQIAYFQPARLVAFEQGESELFRLTNELRNRFPALDLVPVVGDIRNRNSVNAALRENRVEFVLHAAAYKHVPIMEEQPIEAVVNNVFGTKIVMEEARATGVGSLLMISSDKAVNPTNVMGATKRACELMLSAMPTSPTKFVSVRFGNVLGSNGSVIPLFRSQIAAGGPVTVTHPEMRRYFMTIPEAVQLVLVASTLGNGSEIFVLDMGQPVKIVDLARNMIRLAGRVPDKDVEIRFVGPRPGEKLFEETHADSESLKPTSNAKIRIFESSKLESETVEAWAAETHRLVEAGDKRGVVRQLAELVPEYQPDRCWNLPRRLPQTAAQASLFSGLEGVKARGAIRMTPASSPSR